MENVFERCEGVFFTLKTHHFEHVGNVMSYPERSISRLSHVKSTWAFFVMRWQKWEVIVGALFSTVGT